MPAPTDLTTIDDNAAAPERSLREELQAAYDAAPTDDDDAVSAAGTPAEPASRGRDDRGRFAGKTDATDATIVDPAARAAAPAAPGASTGTVDPAAQAAQAAAAPIAAPQNIKGELRAEWDKLSPAAQRAIVERETEVHRGFTRMDEERQFGKSLRDVINPYMPLIQAQGSDPVKAVGSLLNTAYILTAGTPAQKVQALQSVAQQYGIPLDQVTQFQPQQRVDPHVAALQQQVQQLTQARQQELTQREQQEQHQIQTEIAAFAAAPGHEHFEQVKPHLAALLTNGLAKDLQDAYDQAVWARPDLRATVLAAQQQTAEQARVTQAQARAAAAKKAGASVAGTPGASMPASVPDRSLRDELRANLRASH